MTDQLNPCPFCGDIALFSKSKEYILCNNMKCGLEYHKITDDLDMISSWNTRHELEKYEKLLEFVKFLAEYEKDNSAIFILKEIGEE